MCYNRFKRDLKLLGGRPTPWPLITLTELNNKRTRQRNRGAILFAITLMLFAGCKLALPDYSVLVPTSSIVGRWNLSGVGVNLTLWFYDDGTMHRESTVGGWTTETAGYYTASGTTLTQQYIGSASDVSTFAVSGQILTLTIVGWGSIPVERQETLDRPTNSRPTIAVHEAASTASVGDTISCTAVASDTDVGQTLVYGWFVDDVAQAGATTDSFNYVVPSPGSTTHTIKAVVSDGYDVAADSVVLTVAAAVSTGFEQWNGSSWVSLGLSVPAGTVNAFTYYGNPTVRLSNNELWTYSSGAWSQLGFSAPSDTVQATSLDSSLASLHYAETRNATGDASMYDTGTTAWLAMSATYPLLSIPSSSIDFLLGGSGLLVVLSDGTLQECNYSAPPLAPFGGQLQGTIARIAFGDLGSTVAMLAVTNAGEIYTCAGSPDTWVDSGVAVPSGTLDVFLCGGKLTIRR